MHRRQTILFAVVAACIAIAVLPAAAFAIPRDVVLARGMVWVNHIQSSSKGKVVRGVPYSQARWALVNGSLIPTSTKNASSLGYRTDCSGFASMCYGLLDANGNPYSECTAGFGAKGSKKYFQITKAQLLLGDMVLASAVWGAPGPHAIIFDGWVDAAQTQFWAMEQTTSSTHNGTILHARSWADAVARKFRPYRYAGLEDPYSDVEQSIAAPDAYHSAAAACDGAYPPTSTATVSTIVIASAAQQADQVTAASLGGAVGGPVLLAARTYLPSVTFDEIKRLKPKRVFVLGSTNIISSTVSNKLASMGVAVVRLAGLNSFQVSSTALHVIAAESKAAKHPVDTAYLATGHGISDSLAAAPMLAKTGRPLLLVDKDSMPSYTTKSLKASGIKKLVLLGSTGAISAKQQKSLRKAGYKVSRVGGSNSSTTSLAIAAYALSLKVGFQWKSIGVASKTSCTDALAWAWANGSAGYLYVTTPTAKLDGAVRNTAIVHRTDIVKARVYGGAGAISNAARASLATALRSGK